MKKLLFLLLLQIPHTLFTLDQHESERIIVSAVQSAQELFPEIQSITWEIATDNHQSKNLIGLSPETKAVRIVLQYYLTLLLKQLQGQHNQADPTSIAHLLQLYAIIEKHENILSYLKAPLQK